MVDAIGEAIEFVHRWKEKEVIQGVITKNNELITNDFEHCINNQIFNPRVIREKLKTLQLFFKVSSFIGLYKLVKSQMEQCKEKRMRIKLKNTKDEFMARVGFLLGPATNQVLILWHEYLIIKKYRISPMNFEIKKE